MNPNEFGLYMIILPHEARFCTIFGKIFKEKSYICIRIAYFQFGTLKYIDVICLCGSGFISLSYLTSNYFCYETENVFSDARFRSMRSGYAKL